MQFLPRPILAKWKRNPKAMIGTWAIYYNERQGREVNYQNSILECIHVQNRRALFMSQDTAYLGEHFWIPLTSVFDPDSRLSYLGPRSRLEWLGIDNLVVDDMIPFGTEGHFNRVYRFGYTVQTETVDFETVTRYSSFEISAAILNLRKPTRQERNDAMRIQWMRDHGRAQTDADRRPQIVTDVCEVLPEASEIERITAWDMIDETV